MWFPYSAIAEIKKNDVYLPAQQTWTYLLYLQLQYQKLLDVTASYCITTFKYPFKTNHHY